MIYKGYTIKRDTTRTSLRQVIDTNGKVIALESLIIDCKKIVDAHIKAGA